MLDDNELVQRLQKLSGPELLDAIAIATGGKTIEEKQAEAAEAVKAYIAKGNTMADFGPNHPLNASALEMHQQSKEQTDD